MSFAEDIRAAIALLGAAEGDRTVDFIVDPGGARRALDAVKEGAGLVIRALPEHGAAATGYAPLPVDPVWIRIMRGATEIGTAVLRGSDGMVRKAKHVAIDEAEEGCCDAPGCTRKRTLATVWIVLEGASKGAGESRLLIAEERVAEEAPAGARSIAASLAKAITVPVVRAGEEVELPIAEAPEARGEAIDAVALARFSMRTEGDRVVVRDWDSVGPRASATRNAWIGALIMVVAAAVGVLFVRAIQSGSQGSAVGAGMATALLALTGYTFISVAQFSAKYRAQSAPLAWMGRDKLVVMPWVGRDGAVDARPEGRFGAAIPMVDVRSAIVADSAGAIAVRLDTDHGLIDVMLCPSRAVAELWCAAIDRAIDDARHPRANSSARKRFRERAAAAAA